VLRIGRVTLQRHHPTVIVPVTDETSHASLVRAARQGLDLAEARVDLYRDPTASVVTRHLERLREVLPVLLTVRSGAEGGAFRADETSRLELYRALIPLADAVDVELGAKIQKDVVRAARRAKKPVVLSQHDFARTPPDAALDRAVTRGFDAGADIVKLAVKLRDDVDSTRLASLLVRHPNRALVVIGMGDHGVKTRVLFPALGSLFTFASLGKSTAPGQLDWPAMRRELALFYPAYGRRLSKSPR